MERYFYYTTMVMIIIIYKMKTGWHTHTFKKEEKKEWMNEWRLRNSSDNVKLLLLLERYWSSSYLLFTYKENMNEKEYIFIRKNRYFQNTEKFEN